MAVAVISLQGPACSGLAPARARASVASTPSTSAWVLRSPHARERREARGLRLVTRAVAGGKGASNAIPVIVNGAAGRMGRATVAAITKARGLELAGAIDVRRVGEDSGEVAGIDANEVPIFDDLLTVLASVAQGDRKARPPRPGQTTGGRGAASAWAAMGLSAASGGKARSGSDDRPCRDVLRCARALHGGL